MYIFYYYKYSVNLYFDGNFFNNIKTHWAINIVILFYSSRQLKYCFKNSKMSTVSFKNVSILILSIITFGNVRAGK